MSINPPISPPAAPGSREVVYPTSDGRPLAETPVHRRNLTGTIDVLDDWYAAEPEVYVSGNMLLFYVKGDKRKHVSPDVFVVRGVPKDKPRKHYLLWEEGRAPDLVIEFTSKSTHKEDMVRKLALYRDVLKVPEYFLFDPYDEYLKPRLKGYRLRKGKYELIRPVGRRLPSEVLKLHLDAEGEYLRLYDPTARRRLPTTKEDRAAAQASAEAERLSAVAERVRAEAAQERAEAQRERADQQQIEIERLRRELESLKRRSPDAGS